MLVILADGAAIHGGSMAQLHSIFVRDDIVIRNSGDSLVGISAGIPGGGNMGTLAYVALLDTLVKLLEHGGHGVGLGVEIPNVWAGRYWCGSGPPPPGHHWVNNLAGG